MDSSESEQNYFSDFQTLPVGSLGLPLRNSFLRLPPGALVRGCSFSECLEGERAASEHHQIATRGQPNHSAISSSADFETINSNFAPHPPHLSDSASPPMSASPSTVDVCLDEQRNVSEPSATLTHGRMEPGDMPQNNHTFRGKIYPFQNTGGHELAPRSVLLLHQ